MPVGSGQCTLASDFAIRLGSNTLPLFHMPHITVVRLRASLRRAIQGEHPSFSHLWYWSANTLPLDTIADLAAPEHVFQWPAAPFGCLQPGLSLAALANFQTDP